MLKCNIAEGTQRPLAIHPFSGVAKKNRKIPSTTEEVEKMTGDQLWHTVGIIQNCSMLTPLSKHNTQGYLPAAMDNLCKLRENTPKSFFDMASAYNQLTLLADVDANGNCLRDFFCFVSEIPGFEYLQNLKLPMGYTASMELCCFILKSILDRCSAVPLHASMEEFLEAMKELDNNQVPSLPGKIYDNLCISYADDGSAQTPMDDFEAYEAYESI